MARLCPRCRGASDTLICPACGIRTADEAVRATRLPSFNENLSSPLAGLLVGLLLSQGCYYGLRHLVTAWILTTQGQSGETEFWDRSFYGLVTLQFIQAIALLVGGMIAAAGRRHGWALGAALGFLNALLLLAIQEVIRQPIDELTRYGTPVLHVFVGTIAGALGSRIWQPAPVLLPLPGGGRIGSEVLTVILPDQPNEEISEPIPWLRIALGITIAVGGTLGARMIRHYVVIAGGGRGYEMQSQFVIWEISMVAQVLGGAIAGSLTRNGAAYGAWVAVPTLIILVMIQAFGAVTLMTHVVPAKLLGLPLSDGTPGILIFQSIQVFVFGVIGGWLGAMTMPADPRRRSAIAR